VYDYVELQFLDRNLQYFAMHHFGKFRICCAVLFTVFLILFSSLVTSYSILKMQFC
jgi:hypothetical protein